MQKHNQQQCTYNVTLMCASTVIVAVEKQFKYCIFWKCVCSPNYPACNAHAPFYHLWNVRFCSIFPHYLKTARFSGEKRYWTQNVCVLIFSTTLFLKHISCWEELGEMLSKMCTSLRVVYRLFLSDFNGTWNFLDRFSVNAKKKSKFVEVSTVGRSCCMRTDGLTDLTKLIITSQFCERE